jgi:hypothetical protein
MEARQRSTARSRIPSRVRTASVPRPQKQVEFSPCTEDQQQKRVRRKWKSFNLGSSSPQSATTPGVINHNNVDILSEWREELADEQNISSLLVLAKDLLANQGGQPLGHDELSYRREQALYWLCKAAERGSLEARIKLTEMLIEGHGVNETNFEAVSSCSLMGGLSHGQLVGRRLGRKTFRKLEFGRGFCTADQVYRLMAAKDLYHMDSEDVKNRAKGIVKVTEQDLVKAGSQHSDGILPTLDRELNRYRRGRRTQLTMQTFNVIMASLTSIILCIMAYFGHNYAIAPLICTLAVLVTLVNFQSTENEVKFSQWSKVWPKGLLSLDISKESNQKFKQRKIITTTLFLIMISCSMATCSVGSYINVTLAFMALFTIRNTLTILETCSYVMLFSVSFFDLAYLFQTFDWTLPHLVNEGLQLLPMAPLGLCTLKAVKPQSLWPPLLLTTFCLNVTSLGWIVMSSLSVLYMAFKVKIHRWSTVLILLSVAFIIISVGSNHRIIAEPRRQITFTSSDLSWSEYSDFCASDPWFQSPKQQIECANLEGLPVTWKGQVAGILLKPVETSNIFHRMIHALLTLTPVQRLCGFVSQHRTSMAYCHFGILKPSLQCNLKIDMYKGRRILGRHTQSILAAVPDYKSCFHLTIGDQITYEGFLSQGDKDLYIEQLITNS